MVRRSSAFAVPCTNPNFSYHSLPPSTILLVLPRLHHTQIDAQGSAVKLLSRELTTPLFLPGSSGFRGHAPYTQSSRDRSRYCSLANTLDDFNGPKFCRVILLISPPALRFCIISSIIPQPRVYTVVEREKDKRDWGSLPEGREDSRCSLRPL